MKQRWLWVWTAIASVAVVVPSILAWHKGPEKPPENALPSALSPDTVVSEGRWQSFEGLMFEKRDGDWYDVMTGEKCKLVKAGSRWMLGPRTADGVLLKRIRDRQKAEVLNGL